MSTNNKFIKWMKVYQHEEMSFCCKNEWDIINNVA
jgi:thiaminase